MKLFILCLAVTYVSSLSVSAKSDPCDEVDCKAGRECVVLGGKGECMCVMNCPDHFKPVCGSDDESYDNHCKLHQEACLASVHIRIKHKGFCKNKFFSKKVKKTNEKVKKLKLENQLANDLVRDFQREEKKQDQKKDSHPVPAVCYSAQRDALRFLLVEHWEETVKNQSWYREGMTFRDNLWGRFFSCDTDKNNYVTPEEILACSKTVPFFARPGQNSHITKALCVDALVDDGDDSRDYRLDFEEFTTILNPDYRPKMKKCSLEGKSFVDGDEVHLDCNHCICAVGKWVCAATKCKTDDSRSSPHGSIHHNTITNNLSPAHVHKTPAPLAQNNFVSDFHKFQAEKDDEFSLYDDQLDEDKDNLAQKQEIKQTLKEINKLREKTDKLKKYWEKQLFEEPHQKKDKFAKKSHKLSKKHHGKYMHKKNRYNKL